MNEWLGDNNNDKMNVWTMSKYKIATQYLIDKKAFYDKMKNKQKKVVFYNFLLIILNQSNKLGKKYLIIYFH